MANTSSQRPGQCLLPVVNFRVRLVVKSASSFSKIKGEAISKSFLMPITARYGVDKTEKRQPRRKAKHLRPHNVCPLLRHPQNDADLEPHPHNVLPAPRTVPLPAASPFIDLGSVRSGSIRTTASRHAPAPDDAATTINLRLDLGGGVILYIVRH